MQKTISLEDFIDIFEKTKEENGIDEKELSQEEQKYLYFMANMFKIDPEFRSVIMDLVYAFTIAHKNNIILDVLIVSINTISKLTVDSIMKRVSYNE